MRLQYKKGKLNRCLLSIDVFFGVALIVTFSQRWRKLFAMLKDSESKGLFLFTSTDNNQINKNNLQFNSLHTVCTFSGIKTQCFSSIPCIVLVRKHHWAASNTEFRL